MKILLVSIPNHHFFQWANQLKNSGYQVHWFDITDGAGFADKISWVKQYPRLENQMELSISTKN
ncbi:hypothetical protein [Flavobacterium davisii]|uniref:hypothetical protein n=1 Tax=Flavobacterium davisii TaxID=2906077 RepID=UPI002164B675|nr:hypothetical protein [Flavobacterium davisii]